MKKILYMKAGLSLLVVFTFIFTIGSVYAEDQAIKMQDLEKLSKEALANAEGTKKIVEQAIQDVEKKMPKDASKLFKGELEGAKMWYKKGNDLLTESKKQIEEKKYTKDLVIDLNQAWRWLVEAGSEITRASMME